MTLLDLISTSPELTALADTNDSGGILTIVNAPSVEHTDNAHYGPGGLLLKLPADLVERCAQVFKVAASQKATFDLMLGTFSVVGFDFSNEVVRASIDTLVMMGMAQEDGDALKAIGRWTTSPAFDAQGHDATKDEVIAVIEQLTQQKADAQAQLAREALRQKAADFYNRSIAFLDANPDATEAEYEAAYFTAE